MLRGGASATRPGNCAIRLPPGDSMLAEIVVVVAVVVVVVVSVSP